MNEADRVLTGLLPPWVCAFVRPLITVALCLGGCVSHRIYNEQPSDYIQTVTAPDDAGITYDLAIIEFDDHGAFWKLDQLTDTLELIERRNAETDQGVYVIPLVHGWKNNADPNQTTGDLVKFREELEVIAKDLAGAKDGKPDRVIGVYLGWRGATSRVPVHEQLTFWGRRNAAERVASLSMREALFRIMTLAQSHPRSKCLVVGHSLGGMIVADTLSPSLTTLLLTGADDGVIMPADLVVLLNPARDGLTSWQFVDFLKRSNATLELRRSDGTVASTPGPMIVSITSEADLATGSAYPVGRTLASLFTAYRSDHEAPQPSQRYLATHTEGHIDYLVSHEAWVEDGEVILKPLPDAYNDTPFWIVRVSRDISHGHVDTRNPMLQDLIDQITQMNRLYEADFETWMLTQPSESSSSLPPANGDH